MPKPPRYGLRCCLPILLATWLLGCLALQAGEFSGNFLWGSSEEASDPGPNLLHDTSASFTWDGQAYSLYATNAPDATARQILEAAIAEIAPGLPIDCFYRPSAWPCKRTKKPFAGSHRRRFFATVRASSARWRALSAVPGHGGTAVGLRRRVVVPAPRGLSRSPGELRVTG